VTFKQTRASVEDQARQKYGEKWRSSYSSILASAAMASRDPRMALHTKVNIAREKAEFGKIGGTTRHHLFTQAHLLRAMIRDKSPGPRTIQDFLTESIVTELCDSDVLEKERQAISNPQSKSIQVKVIEAYRRAIHDDGGAPTLAEVRAELEQDGIASLPKGWKLRNMVTNTFRLPLSRAKRGRPRK
jgi:hypothetical protein